MAERVLRAAHVEARSAVNGIALVKVMGRHAGFIAGGAAIASQDVDFALVPEVPFPLEGEGGFLDALEQRVRTAGRAVVVVAEGAGQDLLTGEDRERDASGNLKHADIGVFLKEQILSHMEAVELAVTLKYIDPSYVIRGVAANCEDRILCDLFARHAAHAAMAGKTDVLIGYRQGKFVHVPIGTATAESKVVDVEGDGWLGVLLATGQPRW
jgi:6-phosphofructokinase 1